MSINIIQFGSGNFLRAYFDWMLHVLKKKNLADHNVLLVVRNSKKDCEFLKKNDNSYHLAITRKVGKKEITEIEKISVFSNYSSGTQNELSSAAQIETLQLVVSNTTEAGISIDANDTMNHLISYPAKLLFFLYTRYNYFKQQKNSGAEGMGMMIFPCELIKENGQTLKKLLFELSSKWKLEEGFKQWLLNENFFYNTLVDRIVPGFPKDSIADFDDKLGFRDELLVQSEEYHFLAVEGDCKRLEDFMPLKKAGFNVIYTDKLSVYQDRKVKILNGLHTSLVPLGLLLNYITVRQTILEKNISKFINDMLELEIIDQINLPRREVEIYSREIIARFANPNIEHRLEDIMLNSTAKLNSRIFPTVVLYIKKNNALPPRLMFIFTLYVILFQEDQYPIKENQELIDFYLNILRKRKNHELSVQKYLNSFFNENPIWKDSEDAEFIFSCAGFLENIEKIYLEIKQSNILDCLREIIR